MASSSIVDETLIWGKPITGAIVIDMYEHPTHSDESDLDQDSDPQIVPGKAEGGKNVAPKPPVSLSRRGFLTQVAVGASALVTATCRRSTPTPSAVPTPTATPIARSSLLATPHPPNSQVYLPQVNKDGVQAVALLPEPTLTPTPPKPTPTPEPPTPTPTPRATPFPPGPPSKLGLFVARNHPQVFEMLATQAVTVVKTLELDPNFVAQIKHTSPATRVVGRIDLPQIELRTLDPAGAARTFVDMILPYADDPGRRPYFDGWEAYNEPVAGNADEMKRLADFEAERTASAGGARHPQRNRQFRHRSATA